MSGKIILEGTVNGREMDYTTVMFAVACRWSATDPPAVIPWSM